VDPELLAALKALSDPQRLRILGRLAARPAAAEDLASELKLPIAAVVRHVRVLRNVGLVRPEGPARGDALVLRLDTLQGIGRQLDELEHGADRSAVPGPDGELLAADDAKVLRAYIEDGRLTGIPAQEKKRLVVLRWLRERVFTEDREYPEKEVNQRLAVFHPDVAALRRYMVDAGLASRAAGMYRRSVDEG
jgi:DNA-binding transcriptional ArsR family regulator